MHISTTKIIHSLNLMRLRVLVLVRMQPTKCMPAFEVSCKLTPCRQVRAREAALV